MDSTIDWDADWAKVGPSRLAEACSALATHLGGLEQPMLEAAAEELWRLADLEK